MKAYFTLLFAMLFIYQDYCSMPRQESSIWSVVVRSTDKKSWQCCYCGHNFAGNSYRVKCHLIGGPGITHCPQNLGHIPQQPCPALRHFFERDIFWSGTKRDILTIKNFNIKNIVSFYHHCTTRLSSEQYSYQSGINHAEFGQNHHYIGCLLT